MRRLLSVFMICLLALRGLLGDAMAMDAIPQPAPAPSMHALAHLNADMRLSPSHYGTAQTPTDTPDCATPAPAAHCHDKAPDGTHCSSCMLCHSAWSHSSAPVVIAANTKSAAHPQHAPSAWASATLIGLFKPPIV